MDEVLGNSGGLGILEYPTPRPMSLTTKPLLCIAALCAMLVSTPGVHTDSPFMLPPQSVRGRLYPQELIRIWKALAGRGKPYLPLSSRQ